MLDRMSSSAGLVISAESLLKKFKFDGEVRMWRANFLLSEDEYTKLVALSAWVKKDIDLYRSTIMELK